MWIVWSVSYERPKYKVVFTTKIKLLEFFSAHETPIVRGLISPKVFCLKKFGDIDSFGAIGTESKFAINDKQRVTFDSLWLS